MPLDTNDVQNRQRVAADGGYKPELAALVTKLVAIVQDLETRVAALETAKELAPR